jgi:hypothetical protein
MIAVNFLAVSSLIIDQCELYYFFIRIQYIIFMANKTTFYKINILFDDYNILLL